MADDLPKLAQMLMGNYNAANAKMNLNPQEQALYQRHLSNLFGTGGTDNPDGTTSTLFQMSTDGPGGKIYNVPRVYDGQIISPDAAYDRATQQGMNTFPSYQSTFEAENRYQQMHNFMEMDKNPMRPYGQPLPVPGNFDPNQPQDASLFQLLRGMK